MNGSAFDDFIKNDLDLSGLRPSKAEELIARWAKLPAQHRMMIGYVVGGLVGAALRRWILRDRSRPADPRTM